MELNNILNLSISSIKCETEFILQLKKIPSPSTFQQTQKWKNKELQGYLGKKRLI